jgi:hypothetical protein
LVWFGLVGFSWNTTPRRSSLTVLDTSSTVNLARFSEFSIPHPPVIKHRISSLSVDDLFPRPTCDETPNSESLVFLSATSRRPLPPLPLFPLRFICGLPLPMPLHLIIRKGHIALLLPRTLRISTSLFSLTPSFLLLLLLLLLLLIFNFRIRVSGVRVGVKGLGFRV